MITAPEESVFLTSFDPMPHWVIHALDWKQNFLLLYPCVERKVEYNITKAHAGQGKKDR